MLTEPEHVRLAGLLLGLRSAEIRIAASERPGVAGLRQRRLGAHHDRRNEDHTAGQHGKLHRNAESADHAAKAGLRPIERAGNTHSSILRQASYRSFFASALTSGVTSSSVSMVQSRADRSFARAAPNTGSTSPWN